MALSRDAILGADDLQSEKLEVPEWGGSVWVRGLTAKEADDFEVSTYRAQQGSGPVDVRAALAVRCCVDEEGNRIFGDADQQQLGQKSRRALDRVFEVCQRLSGLSDNDVDELEKN